MSVRERIAAIMAIKKISQNRLAKSVGISQSGLSSILRGASSPKEDTLRLIASGLGVSVTDLLGDETIQKEPAPDRSRQEVTDSVMGLFASLPPELQA